MGHRVTYHKVPYTISQKLSKEINNMNSLTLRHFQQRLSTSLSMKRKLAAENVRGHWEVPSTHIYRIVNRITFIFKEESTRF